jgi:hypothetical protein
MRINRKNIHFLRFVKITRTLEGYKVKTFFFSVSRFVSYCKEKGCAI